MGNALLLRRKEIALDVLVRSGNVDGVERFATDDLFTDERISDSLVEAGIFGVVAAYDKGGTTVCADDFAAFFRSEGVREYFERMTDHYVMSEFVRALHIGTDETMIEVGMGLDPFRLFKHHYVPQAISRLMEENDERLDTNVRKLIRAGYDILFTFDVDITIDEFSPLLVSWDHLVDVDEVAEQAVKNLYDVADSGHFRGELEDHVEPYLRSFFVVLNSFAGREKVAELMLREKRQYTRRNELYPMLVEKRMIDSYGNEEGFDFASFHDLLGSYTELTPSDDHLKVLEEAVDGDADAKVLVANKFPSWVAGGKIGHVLAVCNYKDGILFDQEVARIKVTYAIGHMINTLIIYDDKLDGHAKGGIAAGLNNYLDLPSDLIDLEDRRIEGFAEAYRMHHAE